MTSADADSSSSLSTDEYYSMLSSYDATLVGDATSFDELDLKYKVSFKSLSCYCTVLGGGEGCCVGEDASVDLTTLSSEDVSEDTKVQYQEEICETMSWALGLEGGESGTTTAATTGGTTTETAESTEAALASTETAAESTTEAAAEETTTGATVAVESTEAAVETTPDSGELPVTTTGGTDAPVRTVLFACTFVDDACLL
jgi:hypothetical protein